MCFFRAYVRICSVAFDIYADIPGLSCPMIEQEFGSNLMALSTLVSGRVAAVRR
jgi:hypothetical protein